MAIHLAGPKTRRRGSGGNQSRTGQNLSRKYKGSPQKGRLAKSPIMLKQALTGK